LKYKGKAHVIEMSKFTGMLAYTYLEKNELNNLAEIKDSTSAAKFSLT